MVEEVHVRPKLSTDEDEAMRAFEDGQGLDGRDIDDATNARLLKIIDKNLLPVRVSLELGFVALRFNFCIFSCCV
jgi:ACS family allantoate permease-like MFS transporter